MNITATECPLCFKNFSVCNIEKHVQHCGVTGDNQIKLSSSSSSSKRKNEFDDEKQMSFKTFFTPTKLVRTDSSIACFSDGKAITDSKEVQAIKGRKTTNVSDLTIDELSGCQKNVYFSKPLYDLARPTTLEDYVGQTEVIGKDTALLKLLRNNLVPSMLFWGPPGCGKSTLAHIIANNVKQQNDVSENKVHFVKLSATNSGKAELQAAIKVASNKQQLFNCKTILFIDEIHRFNKLQQDSLLPSIENGTITLLGATTENPSFVLNSALLSRCRVIVLKKLEISHIKSLLLKTLSSLLPQVKIVSNVLVENSFVDGKQICIEESAIDLLASLCDGDARIALNGLQIALETAQISPEQLVTNDAIKECLQRSHYLYDRAGDQHYDLISALHKSIRGGNDNAALYWLTRMILGGEDPRFIARRLIRMASEDIGLADPTAMNQAVACYQACMFVGMPECDVSLAQCVVYLARAPKSIEVYKALGKAKKCIEENAGPLPSVPLHLRNAPTKLLKDLGCGRDYKYTPEDPSEQSFMPDQLAYANFF